MILKFLKQYIMKNTDVHKKLTEIVRSGKCNNKGCLSGCQDNLEVVWFGQQYGEKLITCSSCYIMNDQAIKKSLPTAHNVLPISSFLNKFVSEAKVYEQNKSSSKWAPTDLSGRQKQHLAEMDTFEAKLQGTIKTLVVSLEKFGQRAVEANQHIYNHETFNEIIRMYSEGKFDDLLQKLQVLVRYLNYGEDNKYRFYDPEGKNKKNAKLAAKINTITEKVLKVLDDLLAQIQEKNTNIAKV